MSGAAALIGCFGADFIQYDDQEHINNARWADRKSEFELFIPKPGFTYIPLALISYNADQWLHGWWTGTKFHSWAPAVRLDNLILHAMAALFLWRLLVRLHFSETRSFFIAMMFACHPLVCETVCWVSERKNAMTAMFGFAAMWTQTLVLRLPSDTQPSRAYTFWRWPAICTLYILSLISKPTTLGLLPIMWLLECIHLLPAVQKRLFGTENVTPPSRRDIGMSGIGCALLGIIAFACVRVNLQSESDNIIAPPGGTVFTALLTDLEIFSRYLFNLACPIKLSMMYYVAPIMTLSDPRVWMYGAALAATFGGTIYVARNRWVALFGWFWFLAALATNANVVGIPYWMQDRYIYLSSPGFWIAVSECAAGLAGRFGTAQSRRILALGSITALSVACMAMSASRGTLWSSMRLLSQDGTQKQPLSFFNHYSYGWSMNPRWYQVAPGSPQYQGLLQVWRREFQTALEKCPDAERFSLKQWVATELGKDAYASGDAQKAEHFFTLGARKPELTGHFVDARVISLAYLSMLDVYFKRDPELAVSKAKLSLALFPNDYGRFALGNAYIASARNDPKTKDAMLAEARKALGEIAPNSAMRGEADGLLESIK